MRGWKQVALDALLAELAAEGLVKAGGKRRERHHARGRGGQAALETGWSWPARACARRWRPWPPRTRTGWPGGSAWRTGIAATGNLSGDRHLGPL